MTSPLTRVPAALRDQFTAIARATDAFCDQRLNHEDLQRIRLAAPLEVRKMAFAQGFIPYVPSRKEAGA
jgi:hypothetical protein